MACPPAATRHRGLAVARRDDRLRALHEHPPLVVVHLLQELHERLEDGVDLPAVFDGERLQPGVGVSGQPDRELLALPHSLFLGETPPIYHKATVCHQVVAVDTKDSHGY